MRQLRAMSATAALAGSLLGASASAQVVAPDLPDVVRGRIVSDSSTPIAAARVIITRGPDRFMAQTTTDSSGRYSVRFVPGTGDYLVYATAEGFRASRRRIQRTTSERELVADLVLTTEVATLSTIKVQAARPTRSSNAVTVLAPEVGASERFVDGVTGQLTPSMAGNLDALATTFSNVTMSMQGPAVLGAGSESNLATLNGSALSATTLPRAARTETRITAASYDATRGGFSGLNIDTRLRPGNRYLQLRRAFVALAPSPLAFPDPVARSLGTEGGSARVSLGADGELVRRAVTYNVAVDAARLTGTTSSLFTADTIAQRAVGLEPGIATQIGGVASALRIPWGSLENDVRTSSLQWLGRIDDTRDSLDTRALTTYANFEREEPVGLGPAIAASAAGSRRTGQYGGQLLLRNFRGEGRRRLHESRLSLSRSESRNDARSQLPGAQVLVPSAQLASGEPSGVTSVYLGGLGVPATSRATWVAEGAHEVNWNLAGNRNRFRAVGWGRLDGIAVTTDRGNGIFSFSSIADLSAGRAASFTRALNEVAAGGRVWNAAMGMAHQYLPSRRFNLIYGARLEASGFVDRPDRNAALEQALGVVTGLAPTRVHVSPRLGFNYAYSTSESSTPSSTSNQLGQFVRPSLATLRGGIGEFRNLISASAIASARSATGLPSGAQSLSCIGTAVPAIDWESFSANPSTIPEECTTAAAALAERAPSAWLLSPSYDATRRWRASLDWSTSFGRWLVRLGGLGSYDLHLPSILDANLTDTQRFALTNEGGRPIFVAPTSIDLQTGYVTATGSRRSPQFTRVALAQNDLRGYGGQLTVAVAPDLVRFRSRTNFYLGANYTLQQSRRQYRGFDAGSFGDPREREWAPTAADARHVFVLSGGVSNPTIGLITLFARAQSGLPFTPTVQGDLNGDGWPGDRAFIPGSGDEASSEVDGLRALATGGSRTARACVARYLGRAADINGCRGPWTQTLNMQWRPPVPPRLLGRANVTVYAQNVLGGVDQLLHGANGLRGWGAQVMPDPLLLVVRGFDAQALAYRYAVNPNFAETRPARSLTRAPFRLTLDVSMDLSVNPELQQLRRAIEPVRYQDRGWTRRSASDITAMYLEGTSSIYKLLVAERDSLFLSREQIERLMSADSIYSARVLAVYEPLGAYLANEGTGARGAALERVEAAHREYWRIFWEQPEIAAELLSLSQRALMPVLTGMLSLAPEQRIGAQQVFGYPVRARP
jgi:hypothetical protein